MKIDNKFKKSILVLLQNSEHNKVGLKEVASNFNAYDINTTIINDPAIRKLYVHLQNSYDLGFIEASSDSLGFLEGSNNHLTVNMGVTYWLTPYGDDYTDIITTPWYKKLGYKIFEESGKLFWGGIGIIFSQSILYFFNFLR